jgi:hypothetical protein
MKNMNFVSLAEQKRSDFLQKERNTNLPSQTGFPTHPPITVRVLIMVHTLSAIANSVIKMVTIHLSATSLGKCDA